jgi:hypothetical protein
MKRRRELAKLPGVLRVEQTGGNHLRLLLANGRQVYASLTPSDWRSVRRTRADVRRELKRGARR